MATPPLTIALLGAECTGKSTLAQALNERLASLVPASPRFSKHVVLVPEELRGWCTLTGRTPQAHEQAERATAQAAAISSAQAQPHVRIVIADTTALSIVAYSEFYFLDTSLYASALALQGRYDLTLLMGLDLPWSPDGLQRDGPAAREAVDALLRRRLNEAGLPYRIVYGQGDARTDHALQAMASLPGLHALAKLKTRPPESSPWVCEQCSDPECERRLFTRLIGEQPSQTTERNI